MQNMNLLDVICTDMKSWISLKVGLHYAICLTNSFVFGRGDCVNFKAMRYESTGLNRILSDKSHRVTLD